MESLQEHLRMFYAKYSPTENLPPPGTNTYMIATLSGEKHRRPDSPHSEQPRITQEGIGALYLFIYCPSRAVMNTCSFISPGSIGRTRRSVRSVYRVTQSRHVAAVGRRRAASNQHIHKARAIPRSNTSKVGSDRVHSQNGSRHIETVTLAGYFL